MEMYFALLYYIILYYADRSDTAVKVLCYKSEGRWNFSLT